jgi:N4-gp56 family major capsid protein
MSAATAALDLTTTLTPEMQLYYEKSFLERAQLEQVYSFLTEGSRTSIPKNSGKSVAFTRQTAYTPSTGGLTEGQNPSGTPFTSTTISATVIEHGNYSPFSSLFEMTTIDKGLEEKSQTMGQYAGEEMDMTLLYSMVGQGTRQYAGAGGLTGVGATDVMTVAQLRRAVKTLKLAKAPKFGAPAGKVTGGAYRAVLNTYDWYNLMGDSSVGNFTTVNTGTDSAHTEQIKNQEIKRLAGVDCVESNNVYPLATLGASSSDTGYISFVAGKGAVGEVDIAGDVKPRIILNPITSGGVANPLQMFGTIGWKVDGYVAKVLNSEWLIETVCRP